MAKRIALGLLALIAIAVAGIGIYFYGVLPRSRAPLDVKAEVTPEALERGKYLAHHVLGCMPCHSALDDEKPGHPLKPGTPLGSGRSWAGEALIPGTLVASNITPHKGAGIGDWTDGEVLRAIREGIGHDGRALFPMMDYQNFRRWPKADLLAIIAYLRSLPESDANPGTTEIDFPVSMFIRAAPAPVETEPGALPTDPVKYGTLLLESMGCKACHTKMDKGEFVEGMEYAGGNEFPGVGGKKLLSPNISSHEAAGLGKYTDAELEAVIRKGTGKDGHLLEQMPWEWYKGLKDAEVNAIIAALRALPANSHVPGT
jgi:hypothetical protein